MNKYILIVASLCISTLTSVNGQKLSLPERKTDAFTASTLLPLLDSLSRKEREEVISEEIISGNIPTFLRQLWEIRDSAIINNKMCYVTYFCTPDYLAIGSNEDYLLMPMSAYLAQKLANFMNTSLPTVKMVDQIYRQAPLKLLPEPIPPSPAMTTLPVFAIHDSMIKNQRENIGILPNTTQLIAGHKKDVIISNKIYTQLKVRIPYPVVIYGWHKPDRIPIQPVYNGHGATYADYSHGIRLIHKEIRINGKKKSMRKILRSRKWHILLSNEGRIKKSYYSE